MSTTVELIKVSSPFDGREVGAVPALTKGDIKRQIDAAVVFLDKEYPQYERAEVLERSVELLKERNDLFAQCIKDEAGKPITIARAEVDRAIDTLRFSAIEARTLVGEVIPMAGSSAGSGVLGFTVREPVGVVAAITPFNFPLNLCVHKLAPAIAAGCPVIHKPASTTPLTAQLLHELFFDAGLSRQALHLATGAGDQIGSAITKDERVKHISFTGSSDVGWAIYAESTHAKVSLELGNSTPLLIFADADLEAATNAAAQSGYSYAGQSCISVQRVLVEEAVYEDVCQMLSDKVSSLKYGDPSDKATWSGPMISSNAKEKVLKMVEDAESNGSRKLVGGEVTGNVIQPILLADVDPKLSVSRDEVFGPVVVLASFAAEHEAIELANGTSYGLQAGIFTSDISRAMRVAKKLEFGGVTVNVTPTYRTDQMPYGGIKNSGNTKEGPKWAVRELTSEKLILLAN